MTDEKKSEADVLAIDAEVEAVYQQMKRDYASTLPGKIDELERKVMDAQSYPADEKRLQTALEEVHRAKGTMGSYGFPEIAELIHSLETLLQKESVASSMKANFWKEADQQIKRIFARAKEKAAYFRDTAGGG
jgi:chemotaxis protein histidine kinase CheA